MNFKSVASSNLSADGVLANIKLAARASVEQSCQLILDEALAIVPRDTGELADSGGWQIVSDEDGRVVGVVFFSSEHAGFVEFGTGTSGAGTYPWPLPTEGVPFTGAWVYDYRHRNWKGHAAQPYLRPAADTSAAGVKGIFVSNVKSAIR